MFVVQGGKIKDFVFILVSSRESDIVDLLMSTTIDLSFDCNISLFVYFIYKKKNNIILFYLQKYTSIVLILVK